MNIRETRDIASLEDGKGKMTKINDNIFK